MRINVHIKDQQFEIECNLGEQPLKWLGDVAIFRYSHFVHEIKSITKGVKLENGEVLDMEGRIRESVEESQHVWIIIQDEHAEQSEEE